MKDLIVALISAVAIGTLLSNKKVRENFGLLPSMTVNVQKEMVANNCPASEENRYQGPVVPVPPNYQAALAPRAASVNYGANILYNLPAKKYQGIPENPLTYGPRMMDSSNSNGVPSCAQNKMGKMEQYDDVEKYEPISQKAKSSKSSKSAQNFEKAQALASEGIVKDGEMVLDTENGPVSVTVYDRQMYANQKSRLYGEGDPIRGDLGCIVPIKDQWFRPSVVPNRDLRQGALTILGGIENDTARELRALQNIYSNGFSNQSTDAYAFDTNPQLAQKSMALGGNKGAEDRVYFSAFP